MALKGYEKWSLDGHCPGRQYEMDAEYFLERFEDDSEKQQDYLERHPDDIELKGYEAWLMEDEFENWQESEREAAAEAMDVGREDYLD